MAMLDDRMEERDWIKAVEQTWIVRLPKQRLATFGSTNIKYYVVTEPIYDELEDRRQEGVVRTGRVIAEKPSIVTPTYAMSLEGFRDEAYEYLNYLSETHGPNSTGILYQYRNEVHNYDTVSGMTDDIAYSLCDDLDKRNEDMSVVMVGVDEYWDLALLKFAYEFTSFSAEENARQLRQRGLLEPQPQLGGVPQAAVVRIERLFREVSLGGNPEQLKQELDRWGLFQHYESRFLDLFRRPGRRQ